MVPVDYRRCPRHRPTGCPPSRNYAHHPYRPRRHTPRPVCGTNRPQRPPVLAPLHLGTCLRLSLQTLTATCLRSRRQALRLDRHPGRSRSECAPLALGPTAETMRWIMADLTHGPRPSGLVRQSTASPAGTASSNATGMSILATTLHFLRVPSASLPRRAPSPDLRLAHPISSLSSDVQKSSLFVMCAQRYDSPALPPDPFLTRSA